MRFYQAIRPLWKEMLRFLFTGGLSTALDFALFLSALYVFPEKNNFCFVLAFVCSAACRFIADKFFTFRHRQGNIWRQSAMYIVCAVATLALGTVIFNAGLWWGLSPLLSKIVSVPFVTISGYLLFKIVVFGTVSRRGM
jgi:putative flippase GtrA